MGTDRVPFCGAKQRRWTHCWHAPPALAYLKQHLSRYYSQHRKGPYSPRGATTVADDWLTWGLRWVHGANGRQTSSGWPAASCSSGGCRRRRTPTWHCPRCGTRWSTPSSPTTAPSPALRRRARSTCGTAVPPSHGVPVRHARLSRSRVQHFTPCSRQCRHRVGRHPRAHQGVAHHGDGQDGVDSAGRAAGPRSPACRTHKRPALLLICATRAFPCGMCRVGGDPAAAQVPLPLDVRVPGGQGDCHQGEPGHDHAVRARHLPRVAAAAHAQQRVRWPWAR